MNAQLAQTILTGWTDRWRYPELAAGLARGTVAAPAATGLLLAGLARPETVPEALTRLITQGEFADADALLLELLDAGVATTAPPDGLPADDAARTDTRAGLDADLWNAFDTTLAQKRESAQQEVERRLAELSARADRIGLPLPDDADILRAAADSRRHADGLLARRATAVAEAEEARRSDLEVRLEHRSASAADEPDGLSAWVGHVRACLGAGEFTVAEDLLDAGPDDVPAAGPASVPVPPLFWPWPDHAVRDILRWYDRPAQAPGPQFERFRRGTDDEASLQVRVALAGLCDRVDGPAVRDLAIGISAALGHTATHPLHHAAGGYLTRIFGLGDPRLPQLSLDRPEGLALWVGDDPTIPPPVDLPVAPDEPIVWFRPVVDPPRSSRGPNITGLTATEPAVTDQVAILEVSGLLGVLAPDGRLRPTGPATRRINLMRLLVPQLPLRAAAATLTGLGRGASPRDHLAWLFDLFGLLPDSAVLDALLYESGGHPVALRRLTEALLAGAPTAGQSGRIGPESLGSVRTAEVRADVRAALVAPLRTDSAARMIMSMMLAMYRPGEAVTLNLALVAENLQLLEIPAQESHPVTRRLDLARTVGVLVERGLLERSGTDSVTPPAAGLYSILRGEPGAHDPQLDARQAAGILYESLLQAERAAAGALAARSIAFIGHDVDNEILSLRRMIDQLEGGSPAAEDLRGAIYAKLDRISGRSYVQRYEEMLRPPERVNLADLVRAVGGESEWDLREGVRLRVTTGDQPTFTVGNATVIREALRNLVRNANRFAEQRAARGEVGLVEIRLEVPEAARQPADAATACAAIEVVDNGEGFSAEAAQRYTALADSPPATGLDSVASADQYGSGLAQTIAWVHAYQGRLRIVPRDGRLGGAAVTMWLPLADPTDRESP